MSATDMAYEKILDELRRVHCADCGEEFEITKERVYFWRKYDIPFGGGKYLCPYCSTTLSGIKPKLNKGETLCLTEEISLL